MGARRTAAACQADGGAAARAGALGRIEQAFVAFDAELTALEHGRAACRCAPTGVLARSLVAAHLIRARQA